MILIEIITKFYDSDPNGNQVSNFEFDRNDDTNRDNREIFDLDTNADQELNFDRNNDDTNRDKYEILDLNMNAVRELNFDRNNDDTNRDNHEVMNLHSNGIRELHCSESSDSGDDKDYEPPIQNASDSSSDNENDILQNDLSEH